MKIDLFMKMQNKKFARYFTEYVIKYHSKVNMEMKNSCIFLMAATVSDCAMVFGPILMLIGMLLFLPMVLLIGIGMAVFGSFSVDLLYDMETIEKDAQKYAEERMREDN